MFMESKAVMPVPVTNAEHVRDGDVSCNCTVCRQVLPACPLHAHPMHASHACCLRGIATLQCCPLAVLDHAHLELTLMLGTLLVSCDKVSIPCQCVRLPPVPGSWLSIGRPGRVFRCMGHMHYTESCTGTFLNPLPPMAVSRCFSLLCTQSIDMH